MTYTLILERDLQKVDTCCTMDQLVSVGVVKPFDITAKFFSVKFETIAKTFAKEPFIVMPYVNSASPVPLEIMDSSVELVSRFVCYSICKEMPKVCFISEMLLSSLLLVCLGTPLLQLPFMKAFSQIIEVKTSLTALSKTFVGIELD